MAETAEELLPVPTTGTGLISQATTTPAAPPLVTPPASTPAGMTLESGPGVNTAGQTYAPAAYTQSVDPTKTVQGLLSGVLDKEGELMRIAAQRGDNYAIGRGMGNSSVAAQASMGSMLDQALPIATADAGIYQQQSAANQNAMNQAAGTSNEFMSADMKMRQEQELTRLRTTMQNSTIDNETRNRLMVQYSDGVNAVMNNPDMTTEQKNAAIARMYENLQGTLVLQENISGVDIGQYRPGGTTTGTGTVADAFASSPAVSTEEDAGLVQSGLANFYKNIIGSYSASTLAGVAFGTNNPIEFSIPQAEADKFVSSLTPQQLSYLKMDLENTIGDGPFSTTYADILANSTLI